MRELVPEPELEQRGLVQPWTASSRIRTKEPAGRDVAAFSHQYKYRTIGTHSRGGKVCEHLARVGVNTREHLARVSVNTVREHLPRPAVNTREHLLRSTVNTTV